MKILRLSTLSLTLAIAVFALGYNPSFADKPPHSHGGGEDPATVFDVAMISNADVSGELGLLLSEGACGTTEDQGQSELDVSFPAGCVTVDVIFETPPTGTMALTAFALLVRSNKSDVLIFFTDGEVIGNTNSGGTYVSDRLPATISRDGSTITVGVDLSGLFVEKNHRPNKGDLAGPIAIGEIVYTPTTP